MTVCIATISHPDNDVPQLIAVTDSMLTAGDIEFDPPQPKIWAFSPNVVALIAGDAADQATICQRTRRELSQLPFFSTEIAAAEYAKQFSTFRREKAEIALLHPLGLTLASFLQDQRRLNPRLVERIENDLLHFELECETIIAGADNNGAYIYVVSDPGHCSCHTHIGFAAVGLGGNHAESQFMFSGYEPRREAPEALLLAYTAKKRAQAAPSVGLCDSPGLPDCGGVGFYAAFAGA